MVPSFDACTKQSIVTDEKRLHKQMELIQQEKRDDIVVSENSSLSKQQGKDKPIVDEVNEEGPKEGSNLLVMKE